MWRDRINVLDKKRNRILQAGGADRIEKQHKSGKLTARERIDMLFDPGTFVEVDSFIESRIDDFGLDKKRVPGDGVVTGYGEINGRTVFVSSEDFTVIGGSLGEYHSMKIARIQDMAYDSLYSALHCISCHCNLYMTTFLFLPLFSASS